jgi:hypothetical protein
MLRVAIDFPDPPINAPPIEYWIDDYLESLRPTLKEAFQNAFRQWLERNGAKSVEKNPFEMSYDEFEKLSEDGQDEVSWQAFSRNKAWIDEQLSKYDAEWIVVIGGKVEKFSSTLDDVPMRNEITKMGMETGLVPFLFIREPLIEESASAPTTQSQWNELEDDDFYPTIPMKDFKNAWATHLGKRYRYLTPKIQIAAQSESRGFISGTFHIRAVYDWATSPFVLINPNRAALVGRNLLLQLGIDVLLKSTARKTIVV